MSKPKDFISEEEFNRIAKSVPSNPRRDSPGDSEIDSLYEIEMGFDEGATDAEDEDDIPAFDLSGADSRTKFTHDTNKNEESIPTSGKAVSSELPQPRLDRDKKSNTH